MSTAELRMLSFCVGACAGSKGRVTQRDLLSTAGPPVGQEPVCAFWSVLAQGWCKHPNQGRPRQARTAWTLAPAPSG